MKRKCKKQGILFILVFCLLVSLLSCGQTGNTKSANGDSSEKEQTVEKERNEKKQKDETSEKSHTSEGTKKEVIMVYMVGSNLESESALASGDIKEMQKSGFDEEELTVLLCTGGSSHWWTSEIPEDACTVFEVTSKDLKEVTSIGNKNMGEADTLTSFVDYAYESYEAENYGLILWDHGGGAILGCGADENYNYDTLSVKEMDTALGSSKMVVDGRKFTWIGFDACLMGMLEVGNALSEYSDYMIASEEIEAGEGWNYDFLGKVSDNDSYGGADTAQCIIDAYGKYYETKVKYVPDYTLSCMDLTKIETVVEKLDGFVVAAEEALRQGGYSGIARGRDQAKTFGRVSDTALYDTVDLYDLCNQLEELYPTEAGELKTAITDCVIGSNTNVPSAYGMAIYFPYENQDYMTEWLQIYSEIGFSENYLTFIRDFAASATGEPLSDWSVNEAAPVESEAEAGEYYVQLSEEEMANYGHATYQLWEEAEGYPGTYVEWLDCADVTLSSDGKLSTNFDGRMFYLINPDSGESVRCCAKELEHRDGYSKFEVGFRLFRGNRSRVVYAQIRVDAEHPNGQLIGFYNQLSNNSTLFPEKSQVEVEEGDELTPFIFGRKIIFHEDGSVAPFEEWEMNSGTGMPLKVEKDFKIEMRDGNEGEEENFCCLFEICDTQGNYHYTNPIYIQKFGQE